MYQLSDVETTDSDEGIRFKTASTRNKDSSSCKGNGRSNNNRDSGRRRRSRSRDRSRSRYRREERRRSHSSRKKKKKTSRKKSNNSEESLSLSSDENVKRKEYPLHGGSSNANSSSKYERRQSDHHRDRRSSGLPSEKTSKSSSRQATVTTEIKEVVKNDKNSKLIGPTLPLDFKPDPKTKKEQKIEESKSEKAEIIGPALPPHLSSKPQTTQTHEKETDNRIRPALPLQIAEKSAEQSLQPPVDAGEGDEDDDDAYGPLPAGSFGTSAAHIALEERALRMKLDQLNPDEDKVAEREKWMLELPEVKAAKFGLGPRQFKTKIGPDLSDRSSWTETPQQKEARRKAKVADDDGGKVDLKKEAELKATRDRNSEQEEAIRKHKKKKRVEEKSLLELHREKLQKEKKEQGKNSEDRPERRPFSRDVDLKVNHFDEAQKKNILKKAQLLDDRFSAGQAKFL